MSQQINLVNPELLPTTPQFTLDSLAQGLAAIALGLALLAGFTHYQLRSLEHETQASNARVAAAQARVARLAALVGARQPNALLTTRIDEARREQRQLAEISALLANGGEPGSVGGYSAPLFGLAQNTVAGVWLTGLHFQGPRVGLEGMALDSERVPRYLSALKRVDGLQGQDFTVFELKKTEAGGGADGGTAATPAAVRFKLDSAVKEQPK